jgi:hypothetical protein
MGRVYADAGDHSRAKVVLRRSAIEFRRNGDRRDKADCLHLERALHLRQTLDESAQAEAARTLPASLTPR